MPRRKGFRLPERIVTLVFEDGPYKGFELDVSLTVPQGVWWKIAEMTAEEADADERETLLMFGRQIRRWNLEGPDGAPIPATPEGFADQLDPLTQRVVVDRWVMAVRKPPESLSPGPRKRRTSARK